MTETACTGLVGCLWAFQTLVTGIFAVISAILTAAVIYLAARLPLKAERDRQRKREQRKSRLRSLELSEEMKLLAKRALQGQSTVKVYMASNANVTEQTRQRMRLRISAPTQDWEYMSLLPETIARDVLQLDGMIEDHNFDMERAGGAFGSDNFRQSIIARLEEIRTKATDLSNNILKISDQGENKS